MFHGNKSLFSNPNVEVSSVIQGNDIYNSAFLNKMMHDRDNINLVEKIETDTRLDIFVDRVAPELDQSIIQVLNKITDWNDIKVGDKLRVPNSNQIIDYSTA